jgi:NADH dehydrogenase
MSSSFHVLVIGGGFTGLTVAQKLAKTTRVTLVSPEEYALFTPRLVDALAGTCAESEVRHSHLLLAERHGYTFLRGSIASLDHDARRAFFADPQRAPIAYDAVVCAQGAETNFFTLSGKEHVYPLKTWDHLVAIEERLRIISSLPHPKVVIVGGGATGIEAAIAIHERLGALGVSQERRDITVVQSAPQILPGFLPSTVEQTKRLFQTRGIIIRERTAALGAAVGTLQLEHDESLSVELCLWASGVKPSTISNTSPTDERGNLLPNHFLQLAPGMYAGGDTILYKCGQVIVPKNAQTAMQMGARIAENVLREQAGLPLKPYTYRSPGVMLWLGRTSIADLFGSSFASPLFTWMRSIFYRLRWYQITQ